MKEGFDQFVENIPFYGFAVLCLDHPEVQAMIPRCRTAASSPTASAPQADVRAERLIDGPQRRDLRRACHATAHRDRTRPMEPFRLPMPGQHNVQNALAAIAVGVEMEHRRRHHPQRASPASAA